MCIYIYIYIYIIDFFILLIPNPLVSLVSALLACSIPSSCSLFNKFSFLYNIRMYVYYTTAYNILCIMIHVHCIQYIMCNDTRALYTIYYV